MIIPTHLLTGVAIGLGISSIFNTDPLESTLVGVGFSLLPDINMLWIKKLKDHHKDFTHYPSFWILVILNSFLIILFQNRNLMGDH